MSGEYLQDHGGKRSSSRLFLAGALLTSSAVMIIVAHQGRMTEHMLEIYLAAWVIHRGLTTWAESKRPPT